MVQKEVKSIFGDCTHPDLVLVQIREHASDRRQALKRKAHDNCDCVDCNARKQMKFARARQCSKQIAHAKATKEEVVRNHGGGCTCGGRLSKKFCRDKNRAHAKMTIGKKKVVRNHGKGCTCNGRLSKTICLVVRARE